jgi:hypothetical protein
MRPAGAGVPAERLAPKALRSTKFNRHCARHSIACTANMYARVLTSERAAKDPQLAAQAKQLVERG